MLLLLLACTPLPAPAIAEEPAPVAVAEPSPPIVLAARRYLGRPWRWGGRGETLDCLGLVFLAWSDVTGKPWRKLSVNPTTLVAEAQLGAPVPGLDGVRARRIDYELLRAGDVVYFLGPRRNPNEPSLVSIEGVPLWVWHVGLYSGGGRFVVGDPFAGEVVETDLAAYLADHDDWYVGIYVTRP
ncbi:MAG: C40 family peptidase [Myxococcota bacterium]